jgi:hypothetical protein
MTNESVQDAPDPLYQFQWMKWLGNVVGAEIVADARINILSVSGHDHNRDLSGQRICLQACTELIAILAGHHYIEQNEIGQADTQQAQQLRRAANCYHLKTTAGQSYRYNLTHLSIVIHYNDTLHWTPPQRPA